MQVDISVGVWTDHNDRRRFEERPFINAAHINRIAEIKFDHRGGPRRHRMDDGRPTNADLTLHVEPNETF